jgi:aminobenzoyl-glutamate utilization protein B
MRHLAVLIVLCAAAPSSADTGPEPKQVAVREVERLASEIGAMAASLWTYSETALRETRSAELLADRLQREGFRLERGVAEMPTAFVASWGEGRPVIGILAEYDALPGVGNASVPRKQAREDGVTSGQGCGHNLFGAGSVGAALALQHTMKQAGLRGTIKLYWIPPRRRGSSRRTWRATVCSRISMPCSNCTPTTATR